MGERADIYEMGLICHQLGLTPGIVQEILMMGASCKYRGISQDDISDLWRIKVRAYGG